ncbi:hypothetical protein ABZ686_16235 [Streptomyces sp. NPDC006992]|uniref:hypothetical protein n=1 Tax=Streptomyces sp. NPDC006992 TaxID=3155601 RepID=UPI0033F47E25
MAISYDDIVNANLGSLEDAAKAWEDMGKKFGSLGQKYRDHVRTAVDADSWQGESAKMFGNGEARQPRSMIRPRERRVE